MNNTKLLLRHEEHQTGAQPVCMSAYCFIINEELKENSLLDGQHPLIEFIAYDLNVSVCSIIWNNSKQNVSKNVYVMAFLIGNSPALAYEGVVDIPTFF